MNREAVLTKMTKGQPVRELANSPFLYMPLSAYRGHFARPVVREGERVLKYQLIAGTFPEQVGKRCRCWF